MPGEMRVNYYFNSPTAPTEIINFMASSKFMFKKIISFLGTKIKNKSIFIILTSINSGLIFLILDPVYQNPGTRVCKRIRPI